jgi:hypothetical protein
MEFSKADHQAGRRAGDRAGFQLLLPDHSAVGQLGRPLGRYTFDCAGLALICVQWIFGGGKNQWMTSRAGKKNTAYEICEAENQAFPAVNLLYTAGIRHFCRGFTFSGAESNIPQGDQIKTRCFK